MGHILTHKTRDKAAWSRSWTRAPVSFSPLKPDSSQELKQSRTRFPSGEKECRS
jgi:hypothetical protein